MKRYFAIVFMTREDDRLERCGCTVDYYPEEEADFRQEEGKNIIGDFATRQEAQHAVSDRLRR
jgi:hypothetical protein